MKLLLSIFALFLCNVHWAQYSRSEANEHFQNLNFKKAITIYHHLESEKKRSRPLFVERLAESYFNINDYTNAKIWYQKLYELKDKRVGEAIFIKYVQSLKAGQEYEAANSLIKEYYDYDQQKLATILEQEKYLDSLMVQKPGYQISNMEINSPFSDFAPMYYKDALVFSSSRTPMLSEDAMYSWNNQPYLSILTAKRDKSTGELSDVQKFHNNIHRPAR